MAEPWEEKAGPAEISLLAQTADRAGFLYLGVCDHVAIPRDAAVRMNTVWYDTVATMGRLAAQTTQVRLLSYVFNVAYRHPLVTAKAFATLDLLSGGRAILGVGAGHVAGEFDALGVDELPDLIATPSRSASELAEQNQAFGSSVGPLLSA